MLAVSVFSDVHSYVFCHAQASLGHRHIHNGLIYIRLRAGQGLHGSWLGLRLVGLLARSGQGDTESPVAAPCDVFCMPAVSMHAQGEFLLRVISWVASLFN